MKAKVFDCPSCGEPISLTLLESFPGYGSPRDVKCERCDSWLSFSRGTRILSALTLIGVLISGALLTVSLMPKLLYRYPPLSEAGSGFAILCIAFGLVSLASVLASRLVIRKFGKLVPLAP